MSARIKLPNPRSSVTHKFTHGGMEGYVTVGFYENDQPGEIFVKIAKEGSVVRGMVDMVAMEASFLLQHGVPLSWLLEKWRHHKFEPVDADGRSLFDTLADSLAMMVRDGDGDPDLNYRREPYGEAQG